MNSNRACDLCGIDVGTKPFYLESEGKRLQFCCDGCLGIYQMLHEPIPATQSTDTQTTKGEKP